MPGELQGWCGRCKEGARLLPWAYDKKEAVELFKLEHGHSPEPIVARH